MLYLPKTPHCWTHNSIIDHGECLELTIKEQSQDFLSFFCAYDKLCIDSIVAENTGSIHHITSSITHNTHTESPLGVFGCEMGVLLLHFQTFSTQETNYIPCLPWWETLWAPSQALGTPQTSTICVALNLVWSLVTDQWSGAEDNICRIKAAIPLGGCEYHQSETDLTHAVSPLLRERSTRVRSFHQLPLFLPALSPSLPPYSPNTENDKFQKF